jgi:hypothetical protein
MREVCPTCDFGRGDPRQWCVFLFSDARLRVGHGYEHDARSRDAAFAKSWCARDHLLTLFGFTDGLGAETAKMLPPRALSSLMPA